MQVDVFIPDVNDYTNVDNQDIYDYSTWEDVPVLFTVFISVNMMF